MTGAALDPSIASALRQALPGADPARAVVIGRGFDVVAWRVPADGGDWTLRVPRLAAARAVIGAQHCLGVRLAGRGFPVPRDPLLLRDTSGEVIAGLYRYADGRHAEVSGRNQRRLLARRLACFLSRLHALPVELAIECGAKPYAPWPEVYESMIERCLPLLPTRSAHWVHETGERLAAASRHLPPPVLVHADLKPEHVLVDENGAIVAVLDFEGARVTDPAADFSRILQNWDEPLARMVLQDYRGTVDADLFARARCYEALDPLELLDDATSYGWPDWEATARRMLAARAAAATRAAARTVSNRVPP